MASTTTGTVAPPSKSLGSIVEEAAWEMTQLEADPEVLASWALSKPGEHDGQATGLGYSDC